MSIFSKRDGQAAKGFREAKGDLSLDSVTKEFGDFKAVDDLSLEVPRGSFFALLGPSGCGKTTTLRMVAGLEQPTRGRIRIGDTDLTGFASLRAAGQHGVPELRALPAPHHPRQRGLRSQAPRRQRRREARGGRARAGADADLAARKPGQLSGGQQQRVALARALVNRPEVLLLDEPLGALDLKLRRQMQVELKRIQTEVGLTFIHVTHDQEEAMTMADTVAVMNAGQIEQIGPPGGALRPAADHVRRQLRRPVQPRHRRGHRHRRGRPRRRCRRDHGAHPQGSTSGPERADHLRCASREGAHHRPTSPTAPATTSRPPSSTSPSPASPPSTSSRLPQRRHLGRLRAEPRRRPQHLRPGDDVWLEWDSGHAFGVPVDEARAAAGAAAFQAAASSS